MLVRAQAASNWREGLQERDTDEAGAVQRFSDHSFKCGAYLSSLSRQFTSLGRMPDLMRSSIGGLRSLDSSFLEKILKPKHLSHVHTRTAEIIQTINLACNKIRKR